MSFRSHQPTRLVVPCPNDEPWQPLGADKKAFLVVLEAAFAAVKERAKVGDEKERPPQQISGRNSKSAAAAPRSMIHMGGFTPWHFKCTQPLVLTNDFREYYC